MIVSNYSYGQVDSRSQSIGIIELKVNASLSEVKSTLLDIEEYGELHPLIKSVSALGSDHYLINEKPYRFIPLNVMYQAFITKSTENAIDYGFSKVLFFMPAFFYQLSSDDDQTTQIHLMIQIDGGPRIGRKILINKMIKAQKQLWLALEQSRMQNEG